MQPFQAMLLSLLAPMVSLLCAASEPAPSVATVPPLIHAAKSFAAYAKAIFGELVADAIISAACSTLPVRTVVRYSLAEAACICILSAVVASMLKQAIVESMVVVLVPNTTSVPCAALNQFEKFMPVIDAESARRVAAAVVVAM